VYSNSFDSRGGSYTLLALMDLVRRRLWLMLGVFSVLFATVWIFTRLLPASFESEMTLVVRRDRVDTPVVLGRGEAAVTAAPVSEADVSLEMELLRSAQLLERAALACQMIRAGAWRSGAWRGRGWCGTCSGRCGSPRCARPT
jgi:uncharacterized protein involved in exopolysaccharide biosynthesis